MSIEDICALPVAEIADKDCALFLWATLPTLPEAFQVIEAWGFSYKTAAFVWVKRNKVADSWYYGMGYWTRANAEICLLATKGKIRRQSNRVHQIIDTRLEAHSKKPGAARDRIVELMGDIPRVELFAREQHPGWMSVGNEIDGKDIHDAIEDIKNWNDDADWPTMSKPDLML